MSQFKFSGLATILHLNARKEGPDDEKELAVDVKLTAELPASAVLPMLGENLENFLFMDGGAVWNEMLGPLTFKHEIEDYRLDVLGSTHFGIRVKKINVEAKDGRMVALGFSVSFKPSGDEVARMAEYLQDAIEIDLRPANNELDLAGVRNAAQNL